MRGDDQRTGNLFAYVNIEARIRPNHPLRPVKALVDEVLGNLSQDFDRLYGTRGRPSIPPEMLLRAMVLQAVYSIRSERQLMERMEFDLLLRWFVGLGMDDPVWNHSTFSKNRDRLLDGDIAARFLSALLALPQVKRLLSNEHFSVDGTLIDAWASMKSFKAHAVSDGTDTTDGDGDHSGGRNAYVDFRGKRRSNQTHASTTDPDAKLYRKGPGHAARLCYLGHGLMENRSGLIVDTRFTLVSGRAERQAAREMIASRAGRSRRVTLGADRGYDTAEFVAELRALNVVAHVAQNTRGRRSAIDDRTTRHQSYRISQRIRKRIEEHFGWMKAVGPMGRAKLRGRAKMAWLFTFSAAVSNLVRLPGLSAAPS